MRKLSLSGSSLILIAVFNVTALSAQSLSETNAKLVIGSGVVEVQRGNLWGPIAVGETVYAGERIRTAKASSAALEIASGKVITLNELSQILVSMSNMSPCVLESGSMKVFSTPDTQIAAKDSALQSGDPSVDPASGYTADQQNLNVFSGPTHNGPVVTRRGNPDPTMLPNLEDGPPQNQGGIIANPIFYVFPYFFYGNHDPNAGAIVPPVVNNPTHPAYRPTQIVPPMSDPIRVPVVPSVEPNNR